MSVGVLTIGKQTWQSFSRNNGARLGAALAYYTKANASKSRQKFDFDEKRYYLQ